MSEKNDIKIELDNLGIELSADKIWNQMKKIRNLNAEDQNRYARRLIWELFQNAKDLSEENRIEISVFLKNRQLIFIHNGKNFSCKDLFSLTTQRSSKAFLTDTSMTGKFGTGFITTHLLSEEVLISGVLSGSANKKKPFDFRIDRSGKTINAIRDAIQKEITEIQILSEKDSNHQINSNSDITKFTYNLKDNSLELALKSIEDIKRTIPFIFIFVKSINKVILCIEDSRDIYCVSNSGKDNVLDFIEVSSSDKPINIISLSNEKVSISVPVLIEDKTIIPLDKSMPRLFCDFPIIGSEKYQLPIIVNCREFDVTEPRDDIYDNDENRILLSQTIGLYEQLIDVLLQSNYRICFFFRR